MKRRAPRDRLHTYHVEHKQGTMQTILARNMKEARTKADFDLVPFFGPIKRIARIT